MSHYDTRKLLSDLGVEWQFNVERAPWWGGVFERMIGSTKKCLRKMIGQSTLTYDGLHTAVVEVEAILNSRPISYVSANDLEEPLTPSHLMVGRRLLSLPDNLYYERSDIDYSPRITPEVFTRRMKYLNVLLDQFWKRWTTEYLVSLREIHNVTRKRNSSIQITKGDVVIVHDERKPRRFWALGRVEQTLPGRDDQIRSAVVRVFTGKALEAASTSCTKVLPY